MKTAEEKTPAQQLEQLQRKHKAFAQMNSKGSLSYTDVVEWYRVKQQIKKLQNKIKAN